MSIDSVEARISYIVSALFLVYAVLYIVRAVQKYKVLLTATPVKNACQAGYKLVSGTCEQSHIPTTGYWLVPGLTFLVLSVGLLIFIRLKKRAALIVIGFILGFAGGNVTVGIVPVAYAAWLLLRAFRLNRYGDPSFAGSSRMAKEQAKARREGRVLETTTTNEVIAGPRTPPPPSKRYTPKKKPRKR
jgi:hypothetical protein